MGVRRLMMILGAVALTLAIAVTAVVAGGPLRGLAASATGNAPGATNAVPAQPAALSPAMIPAGLYQFAITDVSGQGGDREAQCQTFVSNLTKNLGVTTDALGGAVKKTLVEQIDAAQAAGKLTGEQAQTAKDRVNAASDGAFCASLGAGGKVGGGAGHGRGFGVLRGDLLDAAAGYFGITPDVLKQELVSKGSVQAVAAARGKDNATDKAGLQAALEGALRASLTGQGLSADRIEQMVTAFGQGFDHLYTAPIGQGGPHGRPGGFPGQRPSASPSASPRTQ